MTTLAAAFIAAKRAFGPALKDKTNPAFRSKYADLGACLEAVEDALLTNGIALIQETSLDETGVTVETVFMHESGMERRCGKLHVPASKQDPQGYGSALTYARRYSLITACGIAPEDDDGRGGDDGRAIDYDSTAAVATWKLRVDAAINLDALRVTRGLAGQEFVAANDVAAWNEIKAYVANKAAQLQGVTA